MLSFVLSATLAWRAPHAPRAAAPVRARVYASAATESALVTALLPGSPTPLSSIEALIEELEQEAAPVTFDEQRICARLDLESFASSTLTIATCFARRGQVAAPLAAEH